MSLVTNLVTLHLILTKSCYCCHTIKLIYINQITTFSWFVCEGEKKPNQNNNFLCIYLTLARDLYLATDLSPGTVSLICFWSISLTIYYIDCIKQRSIGQTTACEYGVHNLKSYLPKNKHTTSQCDVSNIVFPQTYQVVLLYRNIHKF